MRTCLIHCLFPRARMELSAHRRGQGYHMEVVAMNPLTSTPPRVFISYSHDTPAHESTVLALSDRLRSDGIDTILDQYETFPPHLALVYDKQAATVKPSTV